MTDYSEVSHSGLYDAMLIAMNEGMAAGFGGSKNIDGKTPDEWITNYIREMYNESFGDEEYEAYCEAQDEAGEDPLEYAKWKIIKDSKEIWQPKFDDNGNVKGHEHDTLYSFQVFSSKIGARTALYEGATKNFKRINQYKYYQYNFVHRDVLPQF